MSALDLAKLPLTTLALVGFMFVCLQALKWANEWHARTRARNARMDRLLYHVAYMQGTYREALRLFREDLEERIGGASDQKEAPDAEARADLLTTVTDGIMGLLAPVRPETVITPTAPAGDYISTPGFLDAAEVAANIERLKGRKAGLALAFIEEVDSIRATLEYIDAKKTETGTQSVILGALRNLQFSCARALITSEALLDDGFEAELVEAVDPGSMTQGRLKRGERLYALFLKRFDQIGALKIVYEDGDKTLFAAPYEVTEETVGLLRAEQFRVLGIDRTTEGERIGYVLPAVLIGGFALLMAFSPSLRALFYPEEDEVACTTTVVDGAVTKTECTYTEDTPPEALAGAGQ